MLKYLPNALTILRLLLAVPVGILILRHEYGWAMGVGLLAGVTDALDGFFARRLKSFSRFGAGLDPIADKTLMTIIFVSLAWVHLIPWWLAITVIARDLIIIAGACSYHWLIGPLEFAPTRISKLNTAAQIGFCVLMLGVQLVTWVPDKIPEAFMMLIVALAFASGADYVVHWAARARRDHQAKN